MRIVLLSALIIIAKLGFGQSSVTASFTAADTVCVNSTVNIQNTSQSASNFFWSFCTANINVPPVGTNIGNPGSALRAPVYIDYVFTNGKYYGFVTNNYPGGLVRLDFGNSLLNAPTVMNLGNIGGKIPNHTEGVQIANDNGKWYVLVVGGDPSAGVPSYLTTVSLGVNIDNNAPTATNWGNIGNLSYPHDLYVFKDNNHWYGLTVNYSNSTITLFDLKTSLATQPTATNLGNIGTMSGPTGIQAINDNGSWRVFVTNATSSTLTRLDFGSSLLNNPSGVNLGNPGSTFVTCWDIFILKYCGENKAFVINANGSNDLVRLDFGASLQNPPSASSLGNKGSMSFPHSISKLFRVGADVFSLVTNVNNNTISVLQFPGCTNANIPNSTAKNPPVITYNTPGIYNVNLTVDEGLPTQSSFCKQIVVKDCSAQICLDSVKIQDSMFSCSSFQFKGFAFPDTTSIKNWQWLFGDGGSSQIKNPVHHYNKVGTYTVKLIATDINGCRDSITKAVTISDIKITKRPDTSLCGSVPVKMLATGGSTYLWSPAIGLNDPRIAGPVATPLVSTKYYVTVTNEAGCSKKDSVTLTVNSLPNISKSNDTSVCRNSQVPLLAGGGTSYTWSPGSTLNSSNIPNPVATPVSNTVYTVKVTNVYGCSKTDSVTIVVHQKPAITKSQDTTICKASSIKIFATGGNTYMWSPAATLDNSSSSTPIASPSSSTVYYVAITDAKSCTYQDSIKIGVRDASVFSVSPDDSICSKTSQNLTASGGSTYLWSPTSFLDNPNISHPTATPDTSIVYSVTIRENICNQSATLYTKLTVLPLPDVQARKSNDITCAVPSSNLTASGAQNYIWTPTVGLNNNEVANPTATPGTTTLYTVTGKDVNGCSGSDTISVKVGFNTNTFYGLPNSFTPNGDGLNDCFGVRYWGQADELDFNIYNRFGERVFHTNNSAICWDGKYKGRLQDAGVFVYIIKAKTACGNIDKKGIVMLVR